MQNNIFLKQIPLGPMKNLSYFIGDKNSKKIAIVDPAWNVPSLIKEANDENLNIIGILLTHGHEDHVNGVEELLQTYNVPVYISEPDARFFRLNYETIHKTKDKEEIAIGDIKIKYLLTPGHTPGSQCFHIDNILITGDVLFVNGCGRCDLPGGNAETMYDTLFNKILKLPDSTIIYPGHQYHPLISDTLENQKRTNPFLLSCTKKEFLQSRI